eukprot:5052162-Pleurochrysis_carterae.AAC.1
MAGEHAAAQAERVLRIRAAGGKNARKHGKQAHKHGKDARARAHARAHARTHASASATRESTHLRAAAAPLAQYFEIADSERTEYQRKTLHQARQSVLKGV